MDSTLRRAYFVELIGTFALVYVSAAVVCVNYMTTLTEEPPTKMAFQQPGKTVQAMGGHQPGLLGIALAQGLIYGVTLSVTVRLSGGYLNPAITLMLWVFNRLDNTRTAWYIG